MQRLRVLIFLLAAAVPLAGCVVAPAPPPGPPPYVHWVPGHYNWRGWWVPGHWA